MIETGRVLQQRYRIDKQIGQGGMGAVYIATDERFGSTVAIKETLCMDDNFRKALEHEARLLNSLKHSALPRVSDHFLEDNGQFLVMEYIAGDDVGCMLTSEGHRFSVEQILKWADQLLDALDYLHNQENQVIHRDIKPQNLKITPRGDMILLDFGLAKGNPTDASHKTAAKSIFGYSRNYASLEQIQGTGTDPRSDLYSLAATLYHLLTNISPEDALTRAMAVLSQKPDPLIPANSINSDVPRGLAGVLQKALSLNADERPASASEMRQMLRESENYGYLVDPVTVSAKAGTSALFGQETKLMPDKTRSDFVKQTDIKTEILPANLSELTSVHTDTGGTAAPTNVSAANFTSARSPKRQGFGAAVIGLGLLLVAGLVAGGVYVAKPSLFGGQKDVEKPDTGSAVPPVTPANATSTANANTAPAGLSSAQSSNSEPSSRIEDTRPETATKPVQTTKNGAPSPPLERPQPSDDPNLRLTHSDLPGNIVVTERNADGTTNTKIFKNGQPPPNGRRPPPDQMGPPNGFDMRNLTLKQKQQIRAYMRTHGGQLPPGLPRP